MSTMERLHAGDVVVLQAPEVILATLDEDGALDGLPFMSEMLGGYGRSFRVVRRASKACVDVESPAYGNRTFRLDDVVVLEAPRCDGSGHDGCRRACTVFWKEAWLRRYNPEDPPVPASREQLASLSARLTKLTDGGYFCQSTQLETATEPLHGNHLLAQLRVLREELRNGDVGLAEVGVLLLRWLYEGVRRRLGGDDRLRGPHDRSPVVSLGLRPGDRVRIKSRGEVVATLDRHRSHRGLMICNEMLRCCGAEAVVRERVDRLIVERTGQMRELSDTVSLQELRRPGMRKDPQCLCHGQLGDCPRAELMYWREAWLERLE